MTRFLLSKDGVQYLLSERFNQDDVEIYFAQQRARGHRNDNPSVNQFMENAQALIVQKSLALGGSSNITARKRGVQDISPLCAPLPKKPRKQLFK